MRREQRNYLPTDMIVDIGARRFAFLRGTVRSINRHQFLLRPEEGFGLLDLLNAGFSDKGTIYRFVAGGSGRAVVCRRFLDDNTMKVFKEVSLW